MSTLEAIVLGIVQGLTEFLPISSTGHLILTASLLKFNGASVKVFEVAILPPESPARNFAFDVTPARLVTGLITERGVCAASAEGLLSLYPERRRRR